MKRSKKINHGIRLRDRAGLRNPKRVGLIVITFSVIGAAFLVLSHAATPAVSIEPENSTIQTPALKGTNANASGGGYVQFKAQPVSSGWVDATTRPFAASSPFNTPTPSNTTWHSVPSLLNNPDGATKNWYYNIARVWYAKPTDPIWTINVTSPRDTFLNRVRQSPATFSVRAPANMMVDPDNIDHDHVLLLVSGTNYYEIYMANVDQATRTVTQDYYGYAVDSVLTGNGTGTDANHINYGTRAANFSWLAGLLTGRDLQNGKIDHALAVALTYDSLYGSGCGHTPIWKAPATAWDNGGWCGPIIMGSKIGIPAGVAKPSGLTTWGGLIFDALQQYGAYVGDFTGGAWPSIYTDANSIPGAPDSLFSPFETWGSDWGKITPLLRVAD